MTTRDELTEPRWLVRLQWAILLTAVLYFGHGFLEYLGYLKLRF